MNSARASAPSLVAVVRHARRRVRRRTELHAAGRAGRRPIRSDASVLAGRRRRPTAADADGGFGAGGAMVARIRVGAAQRHRRSRAAWQPDARGRQRDACGRERDARGDARCAVSAGRSRRANVARQQRRSAARRRQVRCATSTTSAARSLTRGSLRRHAPARRAAGRARRFPARPGRRGVSGADRRRRDRGDQCGERSGGTRRLRRTSSTSTNTTCSSCRSPKRRENPPAPTCSPPKVNSPTTARCCRRCCRISTVARHALAVLIGRYPGRMGAAGIHVSRA